MGRGWRVPRRMSCPFKMSWAYTSGTRCLVARNTMMLRRVSMTTCCSPLASHRGNILQHVSSMLMMRLRSVMPASFNVHSILCWQHSSRSVRVVASGHSFPSSPLGFLKKYPSDRMNRRGRRSEKRRCAFRSSANTPAPQHTLLQTRDTMSARARTTAGSRERGRPRAVPKVLCENHLAGGVDVRVLEEGWECPLCEAETLHHGPLVLRRFVQGSAGFSSPAPSPAPSPAATGSSPARSATAVIAMSSCTATCSASVAIVSCIGCPRRHHAGGSGPRSSTLRSMASMSRPRPCRHSVRLEGLPTRGAMGAEDVLSVHGATRDWSPHPVEHDAALEHQRRTLRACTAWPKILSDKHLG